MFPVHPGAASTGGVGATLVVARIESAVSSSRDGTSPSPTVVNPQPPALTRFLPRPYNRAPFNSPSASRRHGSRAHETDLPAECDQAQANPRVPRPHVDEEWSQGAECAAGQGSQETVGLICRMAGGSRRDFGRARRLLRKIQFDEVLRGASVRTGRGSLRLSARDNELEMPRLGLIVGKRMLRRAVDRNRAKRVIRESFRQTAGLPAMDIVVRVAVPATQVTVTDADRLFGALAEIVDQRRSRDTRDG